MKEEEDLGLERTVKEEDIQECLDKAEEIEQKLSAETKAEEAEYFIYTPEVKDDSRKFVG